MDNNPDNLTLWCQKNSLTRVEAKLRDPSKAGIVDPSEFAQMTRADIEGIICACDMNAGEKSRFRTAVKQFQDVPANPAPIPIPQEPLVVGRHTYKLQKLVGKGGFGVVWEAVDLKTKRVVAVKQQISDPNNPKNWFMEEIKAYQLVNAAPAPRVPEMIASSDNTGSGQCLVIEFIPGLTADEYLKETPDFLLEDHKACSFLLKTLETLDAVHKKGLIHRDLKPSNIIIQKFSLEPWILDFGIARDLLLKANSQLTDVGTRSFRSPEYLNNYIGAFTDIFALGATLLNLTGLLTDKDFYWNTVLERCQWCPELKHVVGQMIADDPTERFQTCQAVIDALRKIDLSKAHPAPTLPKVGRTLQATTQGSTKKRDKILRLEGHTQAVRCILQLVDGTVASASNDGTIRIWDLNTTKCIRKLEGHTNVVRCIIQLLDGSLVSASWDYTIKIWDLKTGLCSKTLVGHIRSIYCLVQLTDGTLVSGSHDKLIKIWDLKTGQCIKSLEGHADTVRSAMQLVDGTLVTGSHDSSIQVWDLNSGKAIRVITGHRQSVNCLTQIGKLSDKVIAAGDGDGQIKIWDLKTGQCTQTLLGHANSPGKKYVSCLVQLADGTLASAAADNTIKIWDLTTSQCIQTLRGHHPVYWVIQLRDGTLASGSEEGSVKIWG